MMGAEERLVGWLAERGWRVTTCESCTGGAISARLVDVPGVSRVLEEAYVTYCDASKIRLAGVSLDSLKRHTAVSGEIARQMAEGAAGRARADLALAATGYAGPAADGDDEAGHVFLAAFFQGKSLVREFHFVGDRQEVRRQAVEEAVLMGLEVLQAAEEEENNGRQDHGGDHRLREHSGQAEAR